MLGFRHLAFRVAIVPITAASLGTLSGQQPAAGAKPPSFAVSIKLKQDPVPAGEKPWLILTSKNISDHPINVGNGLPWHLHVEGAEGEPPRTLFHRQLRGEPGVPTLDGGGPSGSPLNIPGEKPYEGVSPGGSDIKQFDLTAYYHLSPGKYTVYMEVRDTSGVWLRTNTVQFEILGPDE